MKIEGELVELPEGFPDHPYFRSQSWSRSRSREIYNMYVANDQMTLEQLAQCWGVSRERVRQIIIKVARVIRHIDAGNSYYGSKANLD